MNKSTVNPSAISISPGNVKMGAIPSVSLPPVITCTNCEGCAKKRYARRMAARYPNVKTAYDRNLNILKSDPASYWLQVRAAASVTRFFRYHVAGDIIDVDYLKNMIQTAQELPNTEFLCFTKNYDAVNRYLDDGGAIPGNLHLIFSIWDKPINNPHRLPQSAVIFKGSEPREDWKICGGNCTECACRGCGCWELKPGETIAFYEH